MSELFYYTLCDDILFCLGVDFGIANGTWRKL